MADWTDVATDTTELLERVALQNAKAAARKLPVTGSCHYCQAWFGDTSTQHFCDEDCRNDWQHEQDAKRRNGR